VAFSASANPAAPGNAPLLQNLYSAAINISVICASLPYFSSSVLSIRLAAAAGRMAPTTRPDNTKLKGFFPF
jgi:hypothetical protein